MSASKHMSACTVTVSIKGFKEKSHRLGPTDEMGVARSFKCDILESKHCSLVT